MSVSSGCFGEKYAVDYCGAKDMFENARDSYSAGEKVTLYYPFIATDTDYYFYVDDEYAHVDYDDEKGFVISFVMPEHPVTVRCESVNTMEPPVAEPVMMIDYYEATVATVGGDGYYEIVLSYVPHSSLLYLDVYSGGDGLEETSRRYSVPDEITDECYKIIDECNFRDWNANPDYYGITGAYYVCSFLDGDNGYIRVSSDHMPDNGRDLFMKIGAALGKYATDEYLCED